VSARASRRNVDFLAWRATAIRRKASIGLAPMIVTSSAVGWKATDLDALPPQASRLSIEQQPRPATRRLIQSDAQAAARQRHGELTTTRSRPQLCQQVGVGGRVDASINEHLARDVDGAEEPGDGA
jgi:hypothetical protein